MMNHQPAVIEDIYADPRIPAEAYRPTFVKSLAMVPIRSRDPLGTIGSYWAHPHAPTPEEVQLLQTLADAAAIAMEDIQLYSEQKLRIAELKLAETAMGEYAARAQTVSHKLLEVQESERRLIARELHDDVGQTLTALKINLQVIEQRPDAAPIASRIAECALLAGRILHQVRALMLDLRPPQLDELGLAVVLRAHAERQLTPAGLILHFSAPDALPEISPAIQIACFRIGQEALTNILRHAGAKHVWIDLAPDGGALYLTIRDDGGGFDYAATRARAVRGGSIGLLSIEERAALAGGRIEIITAPGAGATVRAVFAPA
jgi:signal transduction histidine kinase